MSHHSQGGAGGGVQRESSQPGGAGGVHSVSHHSQGGREECSVSHHSQEIRLDLRSSEHLHSSIPKDLDPFDPDPDPDPHQSIAFIRESNASISLLFIPLSKEPSATLRPCWQTGLHLCYVETMLADRTSLTRGVGAWGH